MLAARGGLRSREAPSRRRRPPMMTAAETPASPPIVVHGISGRPGSALGAWLEEGPQLHGSFWPAVGPLERIVHHVSGPGHVLTRAAAGLPAGAAQPEAVAVRLRRERVTVRWGDPHVVDSVGELLRLCFERGRSSVEIARADPRLVPELQIGAWFQATWRGRLVRTLATGRIRSRAVALVPGPLALRTAADAAFWAGVRTEASDEEWARLARSSYVVLCYHRLAGEIKPGQEELDLAPSVFDRQQRLLRRLGFRPLSGGEILAFHERPDAVLRRRSYVVTADDGFLDCAIALQPHGADLPQLFVPTGAVGGTASWADDEPLAGWALLADLEDSGVAIGSHGVSHAVLPELDADRIRSELEDSRRELHARLRHPLEILAYPHGRYDPAVRAAALASGYRAAYTTDVGRNGAGTDPFCLRRIGVKAGDSHASFLWKVLTGELLPKRWERRRRRRLARASRRRARRPSA